MRRPWQILTLAVLAVAGLVMLNREALLLRLFDRAANKAMNRDVMAQLSPEKLHVVFCGTGSPLPNRDRAEACTAVIAGGRIFVFDAGEGAGKTLAMTGLPLARMEGVWLTHLHSDHFEGLGGLMLQRWAGAGASNPLSVFGPAGTSQITAGLTQAFAIDSGYRIAHHGPQTISPTGLGLSGSDLAGPGIAFDKDGVRITAFTVNHAPVSPAFGYRLDWKGMSVTLSGDTAASANLVAAAKGTDLLVHEVLSSVLVGRLQGAAARSGQTKRAKIMADIPGYHATPQQAGQAAKQAGAKALAITHIVPAVPRLFNSFFTKPAKAAFGGTFFLAEDGDVITIDSTGAHSGGNLLQ
jgi:ribonuclease Z